MNNPYEAPVSSELASEEEKLNQYWHLVRNRRNAFLLYFLLAGPLLNALVWGIVVHTDMPIAIDVISIGVSVIYFAGLIWHGYRVTGIRCYQCQHKLTMGHFFFMKNVRCLLCGFQLVAPNKRMQPD